VLNETGGDAGEEAPFAKGGFDIACWAVGGCLNMVDALMKGEIDNGYALVRPPGHHAESDRGRGFCLLANVSIAARYLQSKHSIQKVAIVDYDVHHGNGTQKIFFKDPSVLFISIHQDGNYPTNEGFVTERAGSNINIPLPAGSGSGAYQTAFDEVILPALNKFDPEVLLVSSGFDASGYDPLAQMMLTSEDYRKFAQKLLSIGKKTLFFHEGGYSEAYVPYCGLRVLETLSGIDTQTEDPLLFDISKRGGQKLQPWQRVVINDAKLMY
jgi:acetoin utilization deacetylase AcuC-like enzyme